MIEEAYCSYEVAKLLKEKGFNGQCRAAYTDYGQLFTTQIQQFITNVLCDKGTLWDCIAPTHQMAMGWLREVHNVNIDIVSVWNQKRFEYQVFVVTPENAKHCYIDDKLYLGYEEAVEAAILNLYKLKLLI